MDDVLSFKHPFSCIISGSCGYGKSLFYIRFLQNLYSFCNEENFDVGIFCCYNEWTAVPTEHLRELRNNTSVKEYLPEYFEKGKANRVLKSLKI